ncbi:acyl-CoA dehydrogenase [Tropicimonas sp. IMCC34011]|uniref:acyl-CoA dehydrogenase n=1 Tax=Tropicimonas sp. IMCC34011 TaxID=2248759 RepID=UPI000E26657B|nr:acyl-CoA dehydrogenase [Tropicimonas sp. IMCC34011]
MPYRAPTHDIRFLLEQVAGFDRVRETGHYEDAGPDVTEAILEEAGKVCTEILAPLQRPGDTHPARLENGVVRTSPGYGDGFRAIADGGWVSLSADPEYGGMGLPIAIQTAVNDMMSGACLSLQLNPLLTQGQIEAIAAHASDEIKALYLPKLISGEWTGTMNLTEPQAGSDVGALTTKAVPDGDGAYRISGQKIYITWGDTDFAENVCHLVLARLPDAPKGTRGISLFLVPKRLPDEAGNAGVANGVSVVSLEEKLGLHGSPTCVMQYEDAKGWLVGPEQGGMAAMFTMMNNARLGVGAQGIGVAEAAWQQALSYGMDRKQGRAEGTGTIAEHPDVRRMLSLMKAEIRAARSIALMNAVALDMARATGDGGWRARAELLIPITKAYGTDTGIAVSDLGIQVHGGMGYVEETGASQFFRDVRVTAIYEGTNGIQAMDLVGRKMADNGEAALALIDEISAEAEAARAEMPELAEPVWHAAENLREGVEAMVALEGKDRLAGATPFLRAFARVLGGHCHLRAARAGGAHAALAQVFVSRLLPEHESLLAEAKEGAGTLYALSLDDLAA